MNDALSVLRRIRSERPRPEEVAGERCEICSEPVPGEHGHVVDLVGRQLLCACRGCYLLFTPEGSGGGHYLAVPERYLDLDGAGLGQLAWDGTRIPVGVAFFFVSSSLGRPAAFYPGPAGATESELDLSWWDAATASSPPLAGMQPDVEALLVRAGPGDAPGGPAECFLVPIDACYELVGRLRSTWSGFDGGSEARAAVDEFFETVRERARRSPR